VILSPNWQCDSLRPIHRYAAEWQLPVRGRQAIIGVMIALGALQSCPMVTQFPRRWPRYSLRTLLVAITATAIGLGLWQRATSLRELSAAHAQQAQRFADSAFAYQKWPRVGAAGDSKEHRLWEQHKLHKKWSQQYRASIWRPWLDPRGKLPEPEAYN
jgi:hypothetical protein